MRAQPAAMRLPWALGIDAAGTGKDGGGDEEEHRSPRARAGHARPNQRRCGCRGRWESTLAASLARVLAYRAIDPTWSRSLAALLPPLLPDARLAAAVSSLTDPDLTLALLSWSHHHHDAPTPLAHSALLRLLARACRFDATDSTLWFTSPAAMPTRAFLGTLVAAYADAGMEGKAAETCAHAREVHGKLLEARNCNRLLRLLVERLGQEDASKLYDEMLAEEGSVDTTAPV